MRTSTRASSMAWPRQSARRGDRCSGRRQPGGAGRADVACQGCAGSAQRALRPLGRRARSAQTTGAFRRERCLRSCSTASPSCDLSRLRRRPESGAARLRQHGGLRPLVPGTDAGGIGAAEASLSAGLIAMGSTSRPPCNRHHPAPLDLRPASDLGIRVAALAQSQRLHLTASPPPNGRTEWR
jgi:hypothetical protein